ncbi:glycosyltransferase family 4 protein [Clostridium perfringens]|uniref:glycosyltransferase family 4 protein n=1 Tax=Clostridium perfringens TaxID=1502 RepID=UPI000E15394F|nr:glycosyltransferase family 4 protein [Clostridium perfringens]MBI6016267.1 glycosyltransferase family 4 protein [Clostridium perfringens]MDH5064250.1 putative glycosyltransferase EpsD [Clostridium perfringens]MDK0592103.1 glycosyltransferase family 4 protein [Clostridium perfringens]MDK0595128.1 glycosyltransferase family 4 protein [Clostridium perfringens]MDU2748964.1 glycosyltransferase family 4 protein [Clostridium perfringens]
MNILYFTHYTDLYGANKSLIEIVKNIRNKGINPIVITPYYGEINKELDRLNIKNYNFKYHYWVKSCNVNKMKGIIFYFRYKIVNYFAIKQIVRKFKNKNIKFIHTNSSVIDIGAKVSIKMNLKHFWHIREFGKEDYNIEFFIGKKKATNFILNNSEKVICISDCIRKSYFNTYYKKVVKIYNAVDLKNNIKKINNEEKLNIVIAGTIIRSKNQLELIKAYSLLEEEIKNRIYIDIIGDGNVEYINEIKDFIYNNNLKNINFLGYIKNLDNLYSRYDLGIVTSLKEGFGRVTVEYMLNGIVPIVTDSGANKEIVRHEETGFVYKLGDIEKLSNILKYLYYNRIELNRISKNASNYAKVNFNIDKLIGNLLLLYK